MKNLLTLLLWWWCVSGFAGSFVIDNCDDTNYATGAALGERVVLANQSNKTEGNAALQVNYNFQPGGQWTKSMYVEKTFPQLLDLRQMEYLTLNVYYPDKISNFMAVITFIDDKGITVRFSDYGFFSTPSASWQNKAFRFSNLEKTQWATGGKAVNLRRIRKFNIKILNNLAITQPGTINIMFDNIKIHSGQDLINEKTIASFENFQDNNSICERWKSALNNPCSIYLEQSKPYSGAKSMGITSSFSQKWTNFSAEYTFESPLDLSKVKYFKVGICGDPGLNDYSCGISLGFTDVNGKQARGEIRDWCSSGDWEEIYLPNFNDGMDFYLDDKWTSKLSSGSCWRENRFDGKPWNVRTDLTKIQKIFISAQTNVDGKYPLENIKILIDNITAGYVTKDLKNFNIAASSSQIQESMEKAPQVPWSGCSNPLIQTAMREKRPIVIYFRKNKFKKCEDFEFGCLLSNDFNMRAQRFLCMFEDTAFTDTVAKQLSVFRVPDVVILSSDGKVFKRFQFNINNSDVYKALDECK